MATKNNEARFGSSPLIDDATLGRLMARIDAEGLELLGPDGVLTELTVDVQVIHRGVQVMQRVVTNGVVIGPRL